MSVCAPQTSAAATTTRFRHDCKVWLWCFPRFSRRQLGQRQAHYWLREQRSQEPNMRPIGHGVEESAHKKRATEQHSAHRPREENTLRDVPGRRSGTPHRARARGEALRAELEQSDLSNVESCTPTFLPELLSFFPLLAVASSRTSSCLTIAWKLQALRSFPRQIWISSHRYCCRRPCGEAVF